MSELFEVLSDEVVVGGVVGGELENGVPIEEAVAAVGGGEVDVGDGEDAIGGEGDLGVGAVDAEGEFAAAGEVAEAEEGFAEFKVGVYGRRRRRLH